MITYRYLQSDYYTKTTTTVINIERNMEIMPNIYMNDNGYKLNNCNSYNTVCIIYIWIFILL